MTKTSTSPNLKSSAPSPSFVSIAVLFALSFFVTAIFSASLKVFFGAQTWREVLVKGLLIPCFTWTVQLILSVVYLSAGRRLLYWKQLGLVCLIGSVALLPAAVYNFVAAQPSPLVSALNVLCSVVVMAVVLYGRIKQYGFQRRWALGWVVLITINMSLYLYSIK